MTTSHRDTAGAQPAPPRTGPAPSARARTLLVVALVVAAFGVGVAPALASFTDQARIATRVGTLEIQPPHSVSASLTCRPDTSTLAVDWKASNTPEVSGQRVNMHFIGGPTRRFDVASATATRADVPVSTAEASTWSFDITVEAMTDFGWTRVSNTQGQFHC